MEEPAKVLESGERMAALMAGLTRRGYSDEQRRAIGSGNWLRVLEAAQAPAGAGAGGAAGSGASSVLE